MGVCCGVCRCGFCSLFSSANTFFFWVSCSSVCAFPCRPLSLDALLKILIFVLNTHKASQTVGPPTGPQAACSSREAYLDGLRQPFLLWASQTLILAVLVWGSAWAGDFEGLRIRSACRNASILCAHPTPSLALGRYK